MFTLNIMDWIHQSKNTVIGSIKKQELTICCLQETHFRFSDTYRFKVNGWKKIFYASVNQKRQGITVLILDKTKP